MIRRAALKKDGGTKTAFCCWIWAKVSPARKPCTNEVLACAARTAWLPFTLGDNGAAPVINRLFSGALFSRRSAMVGGNMSVNKPKPPRITVPVASSGGDQAKPLRGRH